MPNFARLPPEERARLGAKGGKAAQAAGRANRFTPETASAAGKAAWAAGTAHRWSSEEAAAAGRKGGTAKARADRPNDDRPLEGDALTAAIALEEGLI
jgi:hypothetical protein